ncbi:MAG: beta-propeller fold lactonase family protein [candidate division KSB1 bacterium]|nr:beta-propeller fold lactonase family protein [candidate division KSB1 bacterium]MDZ7304081.1 beta-propeller fold lactonase family protein [candidate division KSB1 bacterium]MDZ7312061.1 beta-propeller fold lactonase family protein [candidate division KSB1 bacterium]
MIQDDFQYHLIWKRFSCQKQPILILAAIFIVLLPFWNYAQEAQFISFIADTQLEDAMICSPDGKHVYASGTYTIAVFARGEQDTLKTIQVFNNDHLGVSGIHRIVDLAISPDGRYLYALNTNDYSLLLFARDSSGLITLVEVIKDSVFGSNYRLLLSPDGRHLCCGNGVLAIFERELNSGQSKKIQILKNGDEELGHFNIPRWIAISSDGRHIYGAGGNGTKVLLLSRNTETGRIIYQNHYDIGPTPDGRWDDGGIAISPEGGTVYISALFEDKLLVFTRHPSSGELHRLQTININGPRNLIIAPGGKQVYFQHYDQASYFALYEQNDSTRQLIKVDDYLLKIDFYPSSPPSGICMSPTGDAIYMVDGKSNHTVIHRDTTTGKLSLVQRFQNNIGGTDLLRDAHTVKVSPDGNFLYVGAGDFDSGLSVFFRAQNTGQPTLSYPYPLADVGDISISPDGNHLYLTDDDNQAIKVFAINRQNGSLRLIQAHNDTTNASTYLMFSPDGRHLYMGDADKLFVYARDTSSGQLTLVQKIQNRERKVGEVATLAISPDGSHLYWSWIGSVQFRDKHQVAIFARDPIAGRLTHAQTQAFFEAVEINSMQISPDGKHAYAILQECAETGVMIDIFSRQATTGALTFLERMIFPNWCDGVDLAFAANGIDLYVIFNDPGTLIMFERNVATGQLQERQRFVSWKDGVYGLFVPRDLTLSPDGRFVYVVDEVGVVTFATGRSNTSTVNETPFTAIPDKLSLEQNYPNPLSSLSTDAAIGNSFTTIRYEIPASIKGAVPVELSIYNMQGQLVQTLLNESKTPGRYSVMWNGVNANGERVASGIYFYRIKAGELAATKRLVIVR